MKIKGVPEKKKRSLLEILKKRLRKVYIPIYEYNITGTVDVAYPITEHYMLHFLTCWQPYIVQFGGSIAKQA